VSFHYDQAAKTACAGRRLQRLCRFLVVQLRLSQFAQLVVHQPQELRRGVRIAVIEGGQDLVMSDLNESVPPA
jgi:hypothetical protein